MKDILLTVMLLSFFAFGDFLVERFQKYVDEFFVRL